MSRFYNTVAEQLLVALRGKRSQQEFAKVTITSASKISRWETGTSEMPWNEFCKICSALEINLLDFFPKLGFRPKSLDSQSVVDMIIGDQSIRNLAEQLSSPSSMIGRWRSGEVTIPTSKLFQIFDLRNRTLPHLVAMIADINLVPALKERFYHEQKACDLFSKCPATPVVHCFLYLKAYQEMEKHKDGIIGSNIGISLAEERYILRQLVELGMAKWDGEKYRPVDIEVNTHGISPQRFAQDRLIKAYWQRKAADTFENETEKDVKSSSLYRVYTVNRETAAAIKTQMHRFSQALRKLLDEADSSSGEVTQVLSLHAITYGDSAQFSQTDPVEC